MVKLPAFNKDGLLPADVEPLMTIEEIRQSHLVTGEYSRMNELWDTEGRLRLLDNFELLSEVLWKAGITALYIGGSFVEDKPSPQDIDGYFVCSEVSALRDGSFVQTLKGVSSETLKKQDIWNWKERTIDAVTGERRLNMWTHYRVELLPVAEGLKNGVMRTAEQRLTVPEAFRSTINNVPKRYYSSDGFGQVIDKKIPHLDCAYLAHLNEGIDYLRER